jgi:UDP-GlcNAc3NAcA epimerase
MGVHPAPKAVIKVATIVGARPQFIKAATVSRAMRRRSDVTEYLIHTGQHYAHSMSKVFFEELDIPSPDYNLGIGSLSHGAQTGRMLEATEEILLMLKPDWVLVYGDTNSTLAGALAASKIHIPVAHVEAGLRSFNRRMPEEINRVLVDHLSSLLFAPTARAQRNLGTEGIDVSLVRVIGDVMYDAAIYYGEMAERRSDVLKRLGLATKGYLLTTIHRADNTDDGARLRNIVEALIGISHGHQIVLPLHPRTRESLTRENLLTRLAQHVIVIEPVGYLDMVMLEKHSSLILTDSGGVQKEAYFHGVPCITLRDETEWTELVEAGWNKIVPPSSMLEIMEAVNGYSRTGSQLPANAATLYGNGYSAMEVVNEIVARL